MYACRLLKCERVCLPDGEELHIGTAVQKAYLEVSEEGSEGAAASGRRSQANRRIISCLSLTEPAPSCSCQE